MKRLTAALAALALATVLHVQASHAQGTTVQGEVQKIDEAAGKITLKHGPIKYLGMDQGMTMAFRVKDPAMLKQVKVGDKVQFEAAKVDSAYVVTRMEKSK